MTSGSYVIECVKSNYGFVLVSNCCKSKEPEKILEGLIDGIAITNNGFMLLKFGFFEFIKICYLGKLVLLRYIWLFGSAPFVLC
jgi:hypothetical protein